MAEDEVSEADLSGRLATVLEEIRDVMEKRKQRIEELRQEITNIENCLLYTSPSPRDA